MHRQTARFLLFLALVGTFAPLALAATAAPPHACCLRKAVHQCHGSAPDTDQRAVHDTSCCNHDYGRAVTTSRWAHAQPRMVAPLAHNIESRVAESRSDSPATKLFSSQFTRAPPHISVA